MDRKIALDNLITLDKIFKKNNTKYWISCGTLLGFYRDNNFIGHDTDTDICVEIESLNKNLIFDIEDNGFEIQHVFGLIDDGLEITIRKNGVKTDIFFTYKLDNNKIYHSVYSDFRESDYLKHNYIYDRFETKYQNFLGHDFSVPDDIEYVIKQQYGNEWMIPNKNWIYYLSPKNIQHTHIRVEKTHIKKLLYDVNK